MKISKLLSISLVCTTILASCDLDEETYTFVSGEDVVAQKGYEELVSSAYQTLLWPFEWNNYPYVVNMDCDYQSGPSWAYGSTGAGNFYDDSNNNAFFRYNMLGIHRSNYHSSLVRQINGSNQRDIDNALGELLFLKAWNYFQLVQFYGPVPLFRVSVSEGNEPEQPRASETEIYQEIISCLQEAEGKLYARSDGGYKTGHVCRGSAKALLAKVYATIGSASMPSGEQITVKGGPGMKVNPDETTTRLMPVPITHSKNQVAGYEGFDYKEYYRLAMEKAGEVISEGEFALAPSQQQLWSNAYKNGPEFEFCLQTKAGQGTLFGNTISTDYLGYANPVYDDTWSYGYYVQRDHWLQTFDDWNDDRITWGILHRIPYQKDESGKMFYHFYPERDSVYVKEGLNGYDRTDNISYDANMYGSKLMKFSAVSEYPLTGERADFNWPFMRYAETILIYAEAANEVNDGPTAQAIAAVDELNTRNNSTLCSVRNSRKPFDKVSFRSYILEERAKEFAAEGIRRTDLIRWGIYLQVMNAIGNTDENNVVKRREEKHLLLPLPLNEVNANPYIDKNNPGW